MPQEFPDGKYPAGGKSDIEGIFPPPYYEWFQFEKVGILDPPLFHFRFGSSFSNEFVKLYLPWFTGNYSTYTQILSRTSLCTLTWKNASHTYANTLQPMVPSMASLASHR